MQTYIVIKFDYVKTSTVTATGPAPLWEQDFHLFVFAVYFVAINGNCYLYSEVSPESDCIAFELWSKALDETAEQMIGALCIPLDHITRIDQNGVIIGSGGYCEWYQFDSEFVIHDGCIAGTRGPTNFSILLDAYIEEPISFLPGTCAFSSHNQIYLLKCSRRW